MSGCGAPAGLAPPCPEAGRDEQRLGMEVGEPDCRKVSQALDADVAATPLREELPIEGVQPLELEHVVGEQEPAANEPADRRLHALRREEVRERAEVERQFACSGLSSPAD